MLAYDYMYNMNMRDVMAPIEKPNLRTGVGHGHYRPFGREQAEKNAKQKMRKKMKMRKASRRQNRK